VEVCHRGAVAIQRGEELIFGAGDVSRAYFVRSAAKPFQTLPLLIDDGVQRFSLSQEEVAVTSSSHGGEPFHVRAVRSLLEKGGFAPAQLLCGVHAPLHEPSAHALVRANEPPSVLHNNCSGKHAGMLLQSKIQGASPDRYIDRDHPVQRRIHAVIAEVTGVAPDDLWTEVDGCSAPTFEVPLDGMARGFRNLANPDRLSEPTARAVRLLIAAVSAHPLMIAGHDRFDSDLIAATRGRVFCKIGAEGFLALGIAGEDLGLAIKIDDGATRGYIAVAMKLLEHHGLLARAELDQLARYRDPRLRNHAGLIVGSREVIL